MTVRPYLIFNGRCEEAIESYKKAVGATVHELMRFSDSPEPPAPGALPPDWDNKVMHACLQIGDASIMASDGFGAGDAAFNGFSLALTAADEAQADRWYTALGEGGEIVEPLTRTFFSPCFGIVADRFGLRWMVVVQPPQ